MKTYLTNKSIRIRHTVNMSNGLLKWKCVSVSSELFVTDKTPRSHHEELVDSCK